MKTDKQPTFSTEFLIEQYKQGKTFLQIAQETGMSQMTVYRKTKGKVVPRKRKHIFRDENFLKEIDCEWKAYFLGLLWADGNMRTLDNKWNNSCSVSISLIHSDSEILKELWHKIYKSPLELHIKKARIYFDKKTQKSFVGQESHKLIINSKTIYNDLIFLGCSPNKSLTAILPKIPNALFKHFVRGYFDGDGWVEKSRYTFGCIGSDIFCEALKQKLQPLNLNLRIDKAGKVSRLIGFRKKDAIAFACWLYEGSSLYLERKKIRFDRLRNLSQEIEPPHLLK